MSSFQMPDVQIGDIVLFSRIPEDEPRQAAVVCRVCADNISVFWIAPNTGQMGRIGVRHRDDPRIKEFPDSIQDGGIWIESPQMIARRKVALLEERVDELESLVSEGSARSGRRKADASV